jgi:hypothetical protein
MFDVTPPGFQALPAKVPSGPDEFSKSGRKRRGSPNTLNFVDDAPTQPLVFTFGQKLPPMNALPRTKGIFMLINCKECGDKVSSNAATCPHCGTSEFRDETNEEWCKRMALKSLWSGNCPMCRIGNLTKMDAGSRGAAFGQGNLLGAFTKSHRCGNCGYIA